MTDSARRAALDRMRQLGVLLEREMDASLAADGLSSSRAPVLWVVSASGPQTQRQLSESLRVSPRNITGLVDRLVADGFVTREADPHDRRAALITLTPHAVAVLAQRAGEQPRVANRLFDGWGDDELAAFSAGLTRVVTELRHPTAGH